MSMKKARYFVAMMMVPALLGLAAGVYAATRFDVNPSRYDPAHTFLVQATWLDGIGCPTGAKVATYPSTSPTGTYTDSACLTGDNGDSHNQGLLLAKTGPLSNNAAAQAEIQGVRGQTITELGYDLRKAQNTANPSGSTCDAEAPRFDITTEDGTTYFISCNSPPPTTQTANGSPGWIRLRYGAAGHVMAYGPAGLTDISALKIKSLFIVFDDGQDSDPSHFALSVLDNIDVNGTLVGHGPQGHDTDGGGKGKGHDNGDQGNNGNNGNGND